MKKKVAIVRGKYLNKYEMQSFVPLLTSYDLTAFSSLAPLHEDLPFSTIKLPCPMDLVDFPYKMQILNRIFKDAQYLYGLENALENFDIAHSAETYFNYTKQCLNAKKKGYVKKVVVTVWENIPFNNEGIRGRKEMKQQVLLEADHFIAVSERAKIALILEGAEESKITVVHPGVDIKKFTPAKKNEKRSTKDIRILFVGRLIENKGIFELIEACRLLTIDKALKNYKVELIMIGSGPEKNKLKEFGKMFGVSTIIHKQLSYDKIPQVYKDADIFVAPSKSDAYWQEQWGMVLMEAQASGLPIITTLSGSIPENVGDAAVVIQSADVVSLAQAIKKLMLNKKLRVELGNKARKRAVEVHDIKISAKKIQEVYKNVLK